MARIGTGDDGPEFPMPDTDDKIGLTVRIVVKLRPDEYDDLFRQRIFARERGKGH
jgi:hypothetical protein